jgi:hypothetical protein
METFVESLQKLVEREVNLALTKAIKLTPDNETKSTDSMAKGPIQLQASKSQTVEFGIALFAAQTAFSDGRHATLAEIKEWLEALTGHDLKDFYVIDRNNRARKKDATPFLTMLIEKYNSRSDQLLD